MEESFIPNQQLFLFAGSTLLGLAVIIIGFKFQHITRKVIETIGAVFFHAGVFGVLYYKVKFNIFISLALFVLSLFVLIDPLKLAQVLNQKMYKIFGYLLLLASVVFSLEYFLGFPAWLWILPIAVYLLPYVIRPLKNKSGWIMTLAWLIVLSYVGLLGYTSYERFYLRKDVSSITNYLPFLKPNDTSEIQKQIGFDKDFLTPNKTVKQTVPPQKPSTQNTSPLPQTEPKTPNAQRQITPTQTPAQQPHNKNAQNSLATSLKKISDDIAKMQTDYKQLKQKYDVLQLENEALRKKIEKLQGHNTQPDKPKIEEL